MTPQRFFFTVQYPDKTWGVLVPQSFKTRKGADNAGKRYVEAAGGEGWVTQYRVEEIAQ